MLATCRAGGHPGKGNLTAPKCAAAILGKIAQRRPPSLCWERIGNGHVPPSFTTNDTSAELAHAVVNGGGPTNASPVFIGESTQTSSRYDPPFTPSQFRDTCIALVLSQLLEKYSNERSLAPTCTCTVSSLVTWTMSNDEFRISSGDWKGHSSSSKLTVKKPSW